MKSEEVGVMGAEWGARLLRLTAASLVLLCGIITACGQPAPPQATVVPTRPEDDPAVTLVMRALNASSARPLVDVRVFIDDRLMVTDELSAVGNPQLLSITPHKTFAFRLAPGTHTIKAVSVKGEASLERRFEISGKHWALLGYEYWSGEGLPTPPKSFELVIQNEPIAFQ